MSESGHPRPGGEGDDEAEGPPSPRRRLGEDPTTDVLEEALLGRPTSMGRRQVSRGAGVSFRSARRFWHALGFPLVEEADAMFTEADLTALSRVAEMVREGEVDEEFALAMTRAIARTSDRLAIWQTQLMMEAVSSEQGEGLDGPAAEEAVVQEAALRMTELAERLEPLLLYIWRRQLSAAVNRMLSTVGDEDASGRPLAVGFADLVSFTSVVRRLDERDLARMVQRFEDLCTSIVTAHGGRVVKTAGDEVMFSTTEAAPAAAIALDLVEAMAEDELLPDARVGLAYGDVVHRLGDLFGTTVNRASRLTAAAPPSGVFVDDALARRLAPLSTFTTRPTRRRTLRGLGEVVPSRLLRVTGVRGDAPAAHHP